MLNWANRFNIFCLLDNQSYNLPFHSVDCLLAAGVSSSFTERDDFFSSLSNFYNDHDDWLFGHFNYDIKNEIEPLSSNNTDHTHLPEAFLFCPKVLIKIKDDQVIIGTLENDAELVLNQVEEVELKEEKCHDGYKVQQRLSKEEYITTVNSLKQHIKHGDCYEINFCQEFFVDNCILDPLDVYNKLVALSPNPFSCFYKLNDKYLICASPERYLKKDGDRIISQPIKGTIRRTTDNEETDKQHRQQLLQSEKERSENVMIVDLVRNDLSKICKEGSVTVTDLFGIQSFPQVHQMVSTIEGQLQPNVDISGILKATFPMGSMTGAPKRKVMELIEQYEKTKRGIYSGTVGYITPEKDFDFNVVIRSLVYNATEHYASFHVGSAITFNSGAETEYEECELKAAAIKKVLECSTFSK